MTKSKKTGSRKPKRGRNHKGQWLPGFCPNKHGRGAKKIPLPKSLTEQLADAMLEKVSVPDGNGKPQKVTVYDAVVRGLTRGLLDPGLKTKELIPALKWMDNNLVFAIMREQAQEAAEPPITREDRQLLKKVKALMAEKTAEVEAERFARMAGSRRDAKAKPNTKPMQAPPRRCPPAV